MPEEKEPPRPHGDKLLNTDRAGRPDNPAQAQSDATPDAVASGRAEDRSRDRGRGDTASGIPSSDEDDGAQRRRQYKEGADLVSGTD